MTKKSAATTSEATKAKPATQPVQVATAKRMFLAAKAAVKLAKAKFRQARKTAKRLKKLLRVAKQNATGKPKGKARNERRNAKLKAGSQRPHAAKPTKRKASRARLSTRNNTSSKARQKLVLAPKAGEKPAAPQSARSTKSKGRTAPSSRRRPSPPKSAVVETPQSLVAEKPGAQNVASPVTATALTPAD